MLKKYWQSLQCCFYYIHRLESPKKKRLNKECKRNIDYGSNVSLNAFTSERGLRNCLLAK